MSNPLNIGFNVAVNTITNRLFPAGFDVGPDAPDTLDKLKAHIEKTGRMLVWNGASDNTIFDDEETNWAFRAWHDWVHYTFDIPFTLEGEREVAEHQKGHIRTVYGEGKRADEFCKLIDAEVVGQAEYHEHHGKFPVRQHDFVKAYLYCKPRGWRPVADY